MKIIQAVGWYYPESLGGTEVYVAGLSRRLQDAGHEVSVAAPDPAGTADRFYDYEGISVYRYPISANPSRSECRGTTLVRGAERFHIRLAEQKPDVVHFHTFVTGLGLAEILAATSAGARVVATTHAASLGWICQRGTMMQWGEQACDGICQTVKCAGCELQHKGLPKALAQAFAAVPPSVSRLLEDLPGRAGGMLGMPAQIIRNQEMQRQMLAAVDKFVVLTQWALDAVVANGFPAEKLALNRLGLGQTKVVRKPGPDEEPTRQPVTIGYLGRFDPIKGVCDLAKAAASTTDTALRFEFRGPIRSDAEKHVLREIRDIVGEDPRITIAPPVTPEQAPAVLAGWDVACFPSCCVEGGPTAAIEAHAVGTPVIGARIGGLAELVDDGRNGRLVAPGDWRALAEIFQEIAADPCRVVDSWRRQLPPARTMDAVAEDYLKMYQA